VCKAASYYGNLRRHLIASGIVHVLVLCQESELRVITGTRAATEIENGITSAELVYVLVFPPEHIKQKEHCACCLFIHSSFRQQILNLNAVVAGGIPSLVGFTTL
jgi:hypothetical protein